MSLRRAQVQFHALATGPEAVGRDQDGKAVFAPFCAPDERATVQIFEEKKDFARGIATEFEVLSAHRVAPPCPVFRPQTPENSCGGCHLQHLETAFGRELKRQNLERQLRRALRNSEFRVESCESGADWNYRNKAEFRVQKTASGATEIGFYAHASHRLVSIENCLIQEPKNLETLRVARENLALLERAQVSKILARVASSGEGFVAFEAAQNGAILRELAEIFRENLPHLVGIGAKIGKSRGEILWGRDFLCEEVSGVRFRVAGDGFWQINAQTTPLMVAAALEFLELKNGENALDLYCGSGLFAVFMARAGASVTGIESSAQAVENARFNARENGVSARFFAGDCARLLKKERGPFDSILLDPPRAGAKDAIPNLLRLAPQRLVYVSCDPATLARDLALLCPHYKATRARCFDVFAQTSHLETVVALEKCA